MDDIKRPAPKPEPIVKFEVPATESSESPEPTEKPVETEVKAEPQAPAKKGSLLLLPARTVKKHWIYLKQQNLSKKQWALLITALLIVVGGASFGGLKLYQHFRSTQKQTAAPAVVKKKAAPKPTTEPSRLSGVEVDFDTNKRPVTGVMIENSPDARPQSGLNKAGVVFEAIAEGGITRFLALFQDGQPDYIGPVRSSRPYYLDWLLAFDASYAHVGGAPQALADIKSLGVKDLDQFFNSSYYERITARYAPHNVYTSMGKLDAANRDHGYNSSSFTSFGRKKEQPSATPSATHIDIAISGPLYNVHYDYDKPSNNYLRNEGGKPHIDEKSNSQLSPKVVVALIVPRGIAGDGQHTEYQTTGSGPVIVFQDGIVSTGTWSKADRKAQFTFKDGNGAAIKFNPGQTWFTVADAGSDVTY